MSIIDFEYLKPTTMTLIISLKGTINRDVAFSLLPISTGQMIWKSGQKLPHPGRPGVVISARYKGCVRGIIRQKTRESKKEKKWFKHSVTTDVSTREKTVNMKVSNNNIHLCGATSVEQGLEGVQYLIQILTNLQTELEYLQRNPQKWNETETIIKTHLPIYFECLQNQDETQHMTPEQFKEWMCEQGGDSLIVYFLTRSIHEFDNLEEYTRELDWIHTIDRVIEGPLEIDNCYTAMIKYNFDLGFNVNRPILARLMNNNSGFKARYDNSSEHYVSIRRPYMHGEDIFTHRKKNKIPGHKFSVYESGIVTQSGRGNYMKQVYQLFNHCIQEIRLEIMKMGVHLLRYRPCRPIEECIEEKITTKKQLLISNP